MSNEIQINTEINLKMYDEINISANTKLEIGQIIVKRIPSNNDPKYYKITSERHEVDRTRGTARPDIIEVVNATLVNSEPPVDVQIDVTDSYYTVLVPKYCVDNRYKQFMYLKKGDVITKFENYTRKYYIVTTTITDVNRGEADFYIYCKELPKREDPPIKIDESEFQKMYKFAKKCDNETDVEIQLVDDKKYALELEQKYALEQEQKQALEPPRSWYNPKNWNFRNTRKIAPGEQNKSQIVSHDLTPPFNKKDENLKREFYNKMVKVCEFIRSADPKPLINLYYNNTKIKESVYADWADVILRGSDTIVVIYIKNEDGKYTMYSTDINEEIVYGPGTPIELSKISDKVSFDKLEIQPHLDSSNAGGGDNNTSWWSNFKDNFKGQNSNPNLDRPRHYGGIEIKTEGGKKKKQKTKRRTIKRRKTRRRR